MRYWSGTEINYFEDEQHGVIVTGPLESRVEIPGNRWRLRSEDDDRKFWVLRGGAALTRVQRPVSAAFRDAILEKLEQMPSNGLHPAFRDGFAGEAARLFPEIKPEGIAAFQTCLNDLSDRFGIQDPAWQNDAMVPYLDDFGPDLLVIVEDQPVMVPEIPPVYEAPRIWRQTTWWVNNHMIGPMPDEDLPPDERIIYWQFPAEEASGAGDPLTEGLVYYQGLRFCVAWDAWLNDPDAPSTRLFTQIITEKQARPWRRILS